MKWLCYLCGGLLLLLSYTTQAQTTLAGSYLMERPMEDGSTRKVKLDISEAGTFTVDFGADGTVDTNGNYELSGDQLTILATNGPADAPCIGIKGVYKVVYDAESLNMDRISDPCTQRGGPDGKMRYKRL